MESTVENMLIGIDFNESSGSYAALFASGQTVELNAGSYEDAVIEADHLDAEDYA